MNQTGDPQKNRSQVAYNLTLAAVAGQVGCLTLFVIFLALFGGLWLDSKFDSRPIFTVVLMVGSVPVTLFAMFWIVRKATSRLTNGTQSKTNPSEEGVDRGKTS